jgi:UDP-N-acetylglucosamine:LPS N-acetylglucosamine transferase
VVIVSASIGGGHNAAAKELARDLHANGHDGRVVEFLDAAPLRIGWLVQRIYRWLLRRAPWGYDLLYRLWYLFPFLWAPLVVFVGGLSRRRLVRRVLQELPDAIVSTYPLSSLVLGHERAKGRIDVPVITYLTDFSVHPLWVHPGVDVHLAVTPEAAAAAESLAGKVAYVSGPLVRPEFRRGSASRNRIRHELGLAPDQTVALVVAGSWGVGDVEQTVADIHADQRFTTITVCGSDEALCRRLHQKGMGRVIGWTDQMAELMVACDVLVENAGGLTSLEAMTIGLPVVTYRPIPGHGKDNAAAMAAAGATRLARDARELHLALDDLGRTGFQRDRAIRRGIAVAKGDPTTLVVQIAQGQQPNNVVSLDVESLPNLTAATAP